MTTELAPYIGPSSDVARHVPVLAAMAAVVLINIFGMVSFVMVAAGQTSIRNPRWRTFISIAILSAVITATNAFSGV